MFWKAAAVTAFAIGGCIGGPAAHATLSLNATVGGVPTGVSYVNFDTLPLGAAGGSSGGIAVSFTPDGQAVSGSAANVYAAPFLSSSNGALFGDNANGPDTTTYLSTGLGSATLSFPGAEKYIGLLWGSVDSYNTLSLYNGATLVGSITGSQVAASADGDQGINGTYYVNVNSTVPFDRIVATSSQYAFEFDNVAYNSSVVHSVGVPEPAALAVLCVGLIGAGVARRRPVA